MEKRNALEKKNYDVHNVMGFYILKIGIIFAVTGLVWGFQWLAYTCYKVFASEKSLIYEEPLSKINLNRPAYSIIKPLDSVWL